MSAKIWCLCKRFRMKNKTNEMCNKLKSIQHQLTYKRNMFISNGKITISNACSWLQWLLFTYTLIKLQLRLLTTIETFRSTFTDAFRTPYDIVDRVCVNSFISYFFSSFFIFASFRFIHCHIHEKCCFQFSKARSTRQLTIPTKPNQFRL